MNRRNYARELDKIIENNGYNKPKLLLHACCGPCSSSVIEYLHEHFDITILWYNPNIYPESEYKKRFDTLKELLEKMELADNIPLIVQSWSAQDYLEKVKGLESEPEGGRRCEVCFKVRLTECAKIAKENGFDYFCTTLTVSRHKDAVLINKLGEEIESEYEIKWLPSDFKKHNGENRSVELSEKYDIYRQLYCGCIFSLNDRIIRSKTETE